MHPKNIYIITVKVICPISTNYFSIGLSLEKIGTEIRVHSWVQDGFETG